MLPTAFVSLSGPSWVWVTLAWKHCARRGYAVQRMADLARIVKSKAHLRRCWGAVACIVLLTELTGGALPCPNAVKVS